MKRAPGPRGLPLLGNLLEFRRDGLELLLRGRERYGDVVRYRLGPFPVHVVSHPDHARHVLNSRRENYDKSARASIETRLLAGRSLLVANGERWHATRRLMQPAFRLNRMAGYAPAMTESAEDMLADWRSGDGRLNMAAEMMRLTYRIVGRALIGNDLAATADAVEHAMDVTLKHIFDRIQGQALPLALPTPGNLAFKRERRQLHAIVDGVIGRRRSTGCPVHDLLGSFMQARDEDGSGNFDDEWLRDEVVTLLLAGHETTANALSWTWYLLGRHPEIAEKVFQEADGLLNGRAPRFEDLERLVYTRQVLDEAMRLYPPVWIVERRALAADQIGGHPIPAGATVFTGIHTLHHHPEFWDAPQRFDPERFAEAAKAARPDYLYLPFGSGPRMCIGMNFALTEALLILATMIQRCRVSPLSDKPARPELGITLRVKGGLPMQVHWRD